MLRYSSLALAVAVLAAGCLDGPSKSESGSAEGPLAGGPGIAANQQGLSLVYGPGGQLLDATQFGNLPRFEQHYVGDKGANEPAMDIDADGATYYFRWHDPGAGSDLDTLTSFDNALLKSTDGGKTWIDVTPQVTPADRTMGIDPLVVYDAASGRLFVGVYALPAVIQLYWSDDGGSTWATTAPVVGEPVTDSPTMFAMPVDDNPLWPSALFICYNAFLTLQCKRSMDGGLSWALLPSPFGIPESKCGPIPGKSAAARSGQVLYVGRFQATESCAALQAGATSDTYEVAIAASGDGGLTWQSVVLDEGLSFANEAQPTIAVDDAGNAFVAWSDQLGQFLRFSRSTDQGRTWSTPVDILPPGLTAVKLPSIAAGGPGKVALFAVASNVAGGFAAPEDVMAEARWYGVSILTLDGLEPHPTFAATVVAGGDPLRIGPCGFRCINEQGQGMYDYTATKFSPKDGHIWSGYVDLCDADCAQGGPSTYRAAVAIETGPSSMT